MKIIRRLIYFLEKFERRKPMATSLSESKVQEEQSDNAWSEYENNLPQIRIDPLPSNELQRIKIDKRKSIGKFAYASQLLQQTPAGVATGALSKTYRLVMPPGVVGKIMRYQSGLYGTPVVRGGKIVGHAGLKAAGGAIAAPLLVFQIMAIITGQYYLHRINSLLSAIQKTVNEILDFLKMKEEAELISCHEFVETIAREIDLVISNQERKEATLTNLLFTRNRVRAQIIMREKIIESILGRVCNVMEEGGRTSAKLKKLEKERYEIENNIAYYLIGLKILFQLDVLEAILTSDYSSQFLCSRDQYNSMKLDEIGQLFKKIEEAFIKEHKLIREAAIISEDKVKKVGRDIRKMAKRNKEFYRQLKEGYRSTINSLVEFNKEERQFIIRGDELYMIER